MTRAQTGLGGKAYVVTGGRSGIGQAVVQGLLDHGAAVAALDVAPPTGGMGGAVDLVCDVSSSAAVAQAVNEAVERFGGVDGLVQCAGITRDGLLWKLDDDAWDTVLDVNLGGAFRVLRACVPHLRARGGGAVVNVTSINGERGKFGQSNYAASKGGMIALTKTAARELGSFGIRVNAVAPGLVLTPMTTPLPEKFIEKAIQESALGRAAEAQDVADAILFLLSDQARHITGVTLRVDGGQYM